jgi:hypothetical protein
MPPLGKSHRPFLYINKTKPLQITKPPEHLTVLILADTTPQTKEDIYGCVWFTPKQLLTQLENTKEQIRYVFEIMSFYDNKYWVEFALYLIFFYPIQFLRKPL